MLLADNELYHLLNHESYLNSWVGPSKKKISWHWTGFCSGNKEIANLRFIKQQESTELAQKKPSLAEKDKGINDHNWKWIVSEISRKLQKFLKHEIGFMLWLLVYCLCKKLTSSQIWQAMSFALFCASHCYHRNTASDLLYFNVVISWPAKPFCDRLDQKWKRNMPNLCQLLMSGWIY